MLDPFDAALLNEVQRDDSLTADTLAERVPLSPSAIARRLRRLRADGSIGRTIALLGPRLLGDRLRALVAAQPDQTLAELRDALHSSASLSSVWRAVDRLQLTVKKNGTRRRTAPPRRRG